MEVYVHRDSEHDRPGTVHAYVERRFLRFISMVVPATCEAVQQPVYRITVDGTPGADARPLRTCRICL